MVTDDAESSNRFGQQLEEQGLITTVLSRATDAVLRLEHAKPSLIVVDLYTDGDAAPGIATLIRQSGYEGKIAMVVPTANFSIRLAATKLLVSAVESRPTSPVLMASLAKLGVTEHSKAGATSLGFLSRLFTSVA